MRVVLYVLLVSCFVSCSTKENKNTLRIYAASGTRVPCETICTQYELNQGLTVDRNYASSGILAKQIENGADADLFISASKEWIDYLLRKNKLVDSTITLLAENRLAIITSINNTDFKIDYNTSFNINSITPERMAIGDPQYVPVGMYAKAVLDSLNWYAALNQKIIMTKDVTSVLHLVEMNECDWGIVYYTEALQSKKVKIVSEIPTSLHPPILFYMAEVKKDTNKALPLLHFFASIEGERIFAFHGYSAVTNKTYLARNTH